MSPEWGLAVIGIVLVFTEGSEKYQGIEQALGLLLVVLAFVVGRM